MWSLDNFSLGLSTRSLLQLLAAIGAVQCFYWLLLAPTLFAAPNLTLTPLGQASFAQLESSDIDIAKAAVHTPTELPRFECCEPAHYSVKIDFELGEVPTSGLGFIKHLSADNFVLLVNDAVIVSEGRMALPDHTFHGQLTKLAYVPAAILNEGTNTLQYITARSGNPYTDIRAPLVGPFDQMRQDAGQRLWVMGDYRVIVAVALLIVAVFGVLLLTHSTHRLFAAWLTMLGLLWAASSGFQFITDWPIGSTGRLIVFHAIHFALPAAFFCLIDSWTERPIIWLQWAVGGITLLALVAATGGLVYGSMPGGYDLGDSLSHWLSVWIGLATLARIGYHIFQARDDRVIELAILSLGAVALGLDAWSEITTQRAAGNFRDAAPILLIGLSFAFLSRNFHLFRSAQDINDSLSTELANRQTELDLAYEQQRELLQEQSYQEERQRIVRDMHDGLGSDLMSLYVATKRGQAEPSWVAEGLQSVIDEMRLMMDSMESVGESLGAALVTFRDRIKPRVERAGLQFVWIGELEGLPDMHGRQAMHVFRILQEAVTNAIKHSGATTISISIERIGERVSEIRIIVKDDGQGFSGDSENGRGLVNMQTRAQRLGGTLEVTESNAGVSLLLVLPLENLQETSS